jgi:hypothetical protein
MPIVLRKEVLRLFDKVRDKLHTTRGISLANTKASDYYEMLSEEINDFAFQKVKSRYLQKELNSSFQRTRSDTVFVNPDTLNALMAYWKEDRDARYEDEFATGGSETELLKYAIQRVERTEMTISDTDIRKPEFPVGNPAYPASPHYPFRHGDFKKLWLKDESFNPTGTHKDRMAWEVVRFYKKKLLDFIAGSPTSPQGGNHVQVPRLSLISSGCAAVAIQNLLNDFSLPSVKVLIDRRTTGVIRQTLENYGCELFETDLARQALLSENILQLTGNPGGIDVTFGKGWGLEDIRFDYYDWLSYEVLNQNPDVCIVPFGTGNLFRNVLEINRRELSASVNDKRFFGEKGILKNCLFLGATCVFGKTDTVMDKLYTPYNSFRDFDFREYLPFCHPRSAVVEVEEQHVHQALELAQSLGIQCEPSGIAGLGLLLQMENVLPKDKKILVVNTGRLKTVNSPVPVAL